MSEQIKYYVYRSAKTGKFVSKKYALENPETTVRETIVRRLNK